MRFWSKAPHHLSLRPEGQLSLKDWLYLKRRGFSFLLFSFILPLPSISFFNPSLQWFHHICPFWINANSNYPLELGTTPIIHLFLCCFFLWCCLIIAVFIKEGRSKGMFKKWDDLWHKAWNSRPIKKMCASVGLSRSRLLLKRRVWFITARNKDSV